MQLYYIDNFEFTLTTGKSIATDYFTMPVGNTVFTDALGDNNDTDTPNRRYAVPLTLISAAGTVIASGYATSWSAYPTDPQLVYVSPRLRDAAASVGDKIACRYRADVATAGSSAFMVDLGSISGGKSLVELGEFVQATITGTTSFTVRRDHPSYTEDPLTTELTDVQWYLKASRRQTLHLYDSTAANTISFTTSGGSPVRWKDGVAPTFTAGRPRLLIEFYTLGGYALGTWSGFAA